MENFGPLKATRLSMYQIMEKDLAMIEYIEKNDIKQYILLIQSYLNKFMSNN